MARTRLDRLIFDTGSAAYDVLTNQEVWREQIADVLEHVEDPASIENVLDLGCGPGTSAFVLAERLPEAQVEGIDLSPKMVARAKQHHARHYTRMDNVRFHVGDAAALPWPDGSFDLAVGHSFLYLVPDRHAVLRQACRVLAPGGALVLLEPNLAGSLRDAASRRFGRDFGDFAPGDVARFGMSMVAWRIVSGNAGRLDPVHVRRWFEDAGFDEVDVVPTLGGLGIHCVGRVSR